MKRPSLRSLCALLLLMLVGWAHAGPCAVSLSSPNVAIPYVPANPTNPISSTMSTTCTKTGGNVVTYTVASGATGNFTATMGAASINFSLTTTPNAACGTQWTTANPSTVFTFAASGTQSFTFYICVPAGQNPPAGSYAGTVTLTSSNAGETSTFVVTIITPSNCSLTTPPGPVAFTYTAFQGSAATASTTFGTTCTNLLPYTMALDATSGVVSGLNYTLAIRNSADTADVTGGSGTGLLQNYRIKGTLQPGQAGTCTTGSCVGSDPRTVTITY